MATVTTSITKQYRDLDLNFNIHPIRKDINKHTDEIAVVNSVKNLILTNHYEKPFHPEIGSNVRKMLFENMDSITASTLEREIIQTIENFEPRVKIIRVSVQTDFDKDAFKVQMEFFIQNRTNPVNITFFLERNR